MTTEKAMLDALNRPSIKKKVSAGNIRAMRKRLKDGKMSLDAQVKFLLEHDYFIRAEINWGKPKRKKKGEYIISDKDKASLTTNSAVIVKIEHSQEAIDLHAANHTISPADAHGRKMEAECLNFVSGKRMLSAEELKEKTEFAPDYVKRCTVCGYTPCQCGNPNVVIL